MVPAEAESTASDNYVSQIVKLIPTEIVGVYLGIQNTFLSLPEKERFIAQGLIFLIILVIAPVYLKKVAEIIDSRQRVISIISYCIWGISLGGPFEYLLVKINSNISAQLIGGVLIMLYTLIVPMIYKVQKK